MDKTNSQPKSSNASVGSDQPIEVPDNNHASTRSQQSQPQGQRARQTRPAATNDGSVSHDEPPRRIRRYYDDSDDMIERVRRAREAFDRKANAFQGPDWPYYDKRIIVGKKKRPVTGDGLATSQISQSQNSALTSPVEHDKAKD